MPRPPVRVVAAVLSLLAAHRAAAQPTAVRPTDGGGRVPIADPRTGTPVPVGSYAGLYWDQGVVFKSTALAVIGGSAAWVPVSTGSARTGDPVIQMDRVDFTPGRTGGVVSAGFVTPGLSGGPTGYETATVTFRQADPGRVAVTPLGTDGRPLDPTDVTTYKSTTGSETSFTLLAGPGELIGGIEAFLTAGPAVGPWGVSGLNVANGGRPTGPAPAPVVVTAPMVPAPVVADAPEPAGWVLGGTAAACGLVRRRRRG